ncbi:lipid A biosynthesis acyltransferase [Taibaiella sp. KBW10]|uniref:lysophospholipid acyltransferase family protein n=1 Tax=Taibaiella sp. KBW10 TaxID=2153357 RepID=UPI000F593D98|nr:lysophospholipid acyltransferase family protein [Taibaiella sp. KBW10]RQO29709.1 lipid A biosynthesis acyltransferase [Taibaiella sp. KBW10]
MNNKQHFKFSDIGYYSILGPIFLVSLLPYGFLYHTFGKSIYIIAYYLLRYRYSVIVQNLSRSFPEKTYGEITKITKDFYRHFARTAVENLKMFSISKKEIQQKTNILNLEEVAAVHKSGKKIVAMLGHYGNWECLNVLPELLPFKVNALYKPLSNKTIGRVVAYSRTRFGMLLLPDQKALSYLLRNKADADLTLFIADQYPGRQNGYTYELLHQSTQVFNGAEKLAKATDAAVFYVDFERNKKQGWDARFILMEASAKNSEQGAITRLYVDHLEQSIRSAPEYWLWSHKRWKK